MSILKRQIEIKTIAVDFLRNLRDLIFFPSTQRLFITSDGRERLRAIDKIQLCSVACHFCYSLSPTRPLAPINLMHFSNFSTLHFPTLCENVCLRNTFSLCLALSGRQYIFICCKLLQCFYSLSELWWITEFPETFLLTSSTVLVATREREELVCRPAH